MSDKDDTSELPVSSRPSAPNEGPISQSSPLSSRGPRSSQRSVPPFVARIAERAYSALGGLQSRMLPPEAVMLSHINSFGIARCIWVAAELALADHLAQGPMHVDDLAKAASASPDALYRILRALSSTGIFEELPGRRFSHSRLSECLRSDAPVSMRAWARYTGAEWAWGTWGSLMTTVRNGRTVHENVHGKRFFDHYAENPGYTELFDEAMTSVSMLAVPAIAAACDYSGNRSLVDLAGGQGSLLAAILERAPELRGTLYERPEVLERAREAGYLDEPGLRERATLVAGDIFESVPPDHDAYLLKWILHDWSDEEAKGLLGNVRRAASSGAKLYVVEMLVEPPNEPSPAKLFDLAMLALTGGRERTLEEMRALLSETGFELKRAHATASPYTVLESVAV